MISFKLLNKTFKRFNSDEDKYEEYTLRDKLKGIIQNEELNEYIRMKAEIIILKDCKTTIDDIIISICKKYGKRLSKRTIINYCNAFNKNWLDFIYITNYNKKRKSILKSNQYIIDEFRKGFKENEVVEIKYTYMEATKYINDNYHLSLSLETVRNWLNKYLIYSEKSRSNKKKRKR